MVRDATEPLMVMHHVDILGTAWYALTGLGPEPGCRGRLRGLGRLVVLAVVVLASRSSPLARSRHQAAAACGKFERTCPRNLKANHKTAHARSTRI